MQSLPQARWLPAICAVFVTSLIVANLIAVKLIVIGGLTLPAAIVIFPLSYIIGDVLTEVYGYARTRKVIWIGIACSALAIIFITMSVHMVAAPFWTLPGIDSAQESTEAWRAVFGLMPRIMAASFVAYLCGEFLNAFVLAKLKIKTEGRHLWLRTIGSTIVGQLVDSGLFICLAFLGTLPVGMLGKLIVTQWLVKCIYEAALTPLTYLLVGFLKRSEGVDFYDRETNFNPLQWKE